MNLRSSRKSVRLTQKDDQILSFYAKVMSTSDITATFTKLHDADVSPSVISKVTDAVMGRVSEWQVRELEPLYPTLYLECASSSRSEKINR